MGINFAELPKDNPFSIPAPGLYIAKITKAVSQQPKDTSKPEYLALTYALTDENGKPAGNLFDNFFESDSDVPKYKLGRFLTAAGIPLTGVMEFKDLAKILPNRTLVVDVKNVPDDYKGNGAMKAEVDLFAREAYYPVSEFASLVGKEPEPTPDEPTQSAEPTGNY
jgi:hypothetical protein